MLLEFAPVSGPREYDWTKKGNFQLGVTECGGVIGLDTSKKAAVEFIHDPNKGGPNEGQVTKKLKFALAPDGSSYFVSLQITDKATPSQSANFNLPVSMEEYQVIKSLLNAWIPHFLALDNFWDASTSVGDVPRLTPPPPPPYSNLDD